jgi:hypothetical protein
MSVFKLTKTNQPPFEVEYDGKKYSLPGNAPLSLLEVISSEPMPINATEDQTVEWQQRIGTATMRIFLADVIPAELKKALNPADLQPLVTAWTEHAKLGESLGSGQ